jgi:hypothetical protein
MAYNNNVPLANQRIKDTQQPIRDNFAELDTYTQVNHEPLNSVDAGKHKLCTFTDQPAAPATGATEINVFNAVSTVTGQQELFVKKGAASEIEITAAAKNPNGFTYLPSGIIIQWWEPTITTGSGENINFPIPFPTACLVVNATPKGAVSDPNTMVYVQSFTNTQVRVQATNRTTTGFKNNVIFYFIAIGY